ncbi:MAG: GNAT family N-acetyltransferase [Rhodococcus sp. (in: high G+C Gram-positive bacteria)]|uniref:GNAT family N-acetyltransferase n=1 Tax=Rhodococcus sp. EPR-157 TaxID=1813677 RepID=UPI0007BBD5D1|nr:GNAT family N-acetyltransferase [Rhodococcus sp. EPR-157]KZF05185.1 acetyltransferase [Rhodococcus sp. EPR-157]
MTITVGPAGLWETEQLADVAAVTFPLACPPGSTRESIEAFIDDVLSHEKFGEYLNDPNRTILAAREDDSIVGYAMLIHGEPSDPDIAHSLTKSPTIELSKLYVLPGHHGREVSAELMSSVLALAVDAGCAGVWLGVNQQNHRAQRFYTKQGFVKVGTKTFALGSDIQDDFIMERTL